MSVEGIHAHSVVVGVDGSQSSHEAISWAAAEAERRNLGLHLIHVLDAPYGLTSASTVEADERRALGDVVAKGAVGLAHLAAPTVVVSSQSPRGSAAAVLVEASRVADTVVVGTGLRSVRSMLLGSVAQQVISHASCPVVTVPGQRPSKDGPGAGRVVLAVDSSRSSANAIGYAFAHASSLGKPLAVVHAWWWAVLEGVLEDEAPWSGDWDEIAEEELMFLAEALAGWAEKYPDVEVHKQVVRGHPVEVILEESAGAELLVLGSRGRGGFAGLLLGSVSQGVLHRTPCPVAVVRDAKLEES